MAATREVNAPNQPQAAATTEVSAPPKRGLERLLAWVSLAYVASMPLNETPIMGRSVAALLGAVAIGIWLLLHVTPGRGYASRWSTDNIGPVLVLAAMTVLGFISVFWSWNPDASLSQVSRYASLLFVMLAVSRGIGGQGSAPVTLYLVGALPLSVLTVSSYRSLSVTTTSVQGEGLALNQNEISLILVVACAFALLRLLEARGWRRLPMVFVAVLTAIGCLTTGSRTGMLSLVGVVLVVPFVVPADKPGQRLRRILASLAVVVSVGLILWINRVLLPSRLFETADRLSEGDLSGRQGFWELAFRARSEYLPWGVGAGSGGSLTMTVGLPPVSFHNTYIQMLVELGILGLLLAVAIPITILIAARKSDYKAYVILWMTAWIIQSATGSFDYGKMTWLLAAFAIARAPTLLDPDGQARDRRGPRATASRDVRCARMNTRPALHPPHHHPAAPRTRQGR